jgi:hypothetical protein
VSDVLNIINAIILGSLTACLPIWFAIVYFGKKWSGREKRIKAKVKAQSYVVDQLKMHIEINRTIPMYKINKRNLPREWDKLI